MPGVFIATETTEEAEALAALLAEHKITHAQPIGLSAPGYLKLPRTPAGKFGRTFKTENKTYYIIPPEDGIGFERWSKLSEMLIPMQFGQQTYANIRDYWQTFMTQTVSETSIDKLKVEIVRRVADFLDGIAEAGEKRYTEAAYLCTIFIVEEGEDLTTWSLAKAEAKIEDWKRYDFQDFFLLAAGLSTAFLNDYLKRTEEMKNLSNLNTPAVS